LVAFKKAKEFKSTLDPKTEADRLVANYWISRARSRAGAEDYDGSLAAFQQAMKLNPNLKLDPEAEVKRLAAQNRAQSRLEQGLRWAEAGKAFEALAAFDEAQQIDPATKISANSWNKLCWTAALRGAGARILPACDQAVSLDPDPAIRDSRGLARAQAGDLGGALEDLRAALGAKRSDSWKAQRRRWIADLEARKNPFTPEELKKLREEQ
jgi:tetratricopeptide (TPR) repeat protein